MKWFLLLLSLPCFCQQLTTGQQEVLSVELSRLQPDFINLGDKEILADSIPVSKTVLPFDKNKLAELKSWCLGTQNLTATEAEEIFNVAVEKQYGGKNSPVKWKKTDFPTHKIFLFDINKHVAGYYSAKPSTGTKPLKKINIGPARIVALSYPLINKEGKFAFIKTDSEYHAGVLRIYKNNNGKWELYKLVQLYYY